MIQYEYVNEQGKHIAELIQKADIQHSGEAIVFVGALGICVRKIMPLVADKYIDPAVICVDSMGKYVIPVLSGHIGGANHLARLIAQAIGAEAVITTQSDNMGLWPLDTLAQKYGWKQEDIDRKDMNRAIAAFVAGKPTALHIMQEDEGTRYLRETCPEHVAINPEEGEYAVTITIKDNSFNVTTAADEISLPSEDAKVGTGHIEIVGAGPGDPELVSVRGKRFLESADLILYAGSLVPKELTYYAKPGCVVKSSADLSLEEQFALMKEHYDKGQLVVRLHTGDPCIYGAIQEQMAFFDEYGMDYHITPGISSFLAAAAELRSQFTIPERCQTIILTRGEGRTPMPDKEKLHKLAAHQSTMCIFLSASIVDDVQRQLLEGGYPPETPVAACYKLTWKDQRIYRGQLKDLANILKANNLTLTTMIVVGEAIDNRQGLSKLYDANFTHLFRQSPLPTSPLRGGV